MAYLPDHPSDAGIIGFFQGLVESFKAQCFDSSAMFGKTTNSAFNICDF
jgi:hypothetical protein